MTTIEEAPKLERLAKQLAQLDEITAWVHEHAEQLVGMNPYLDVGVTRTELNISVHGDPAMFVRASRVVMSGAVIGEVKKEADDDYQRVRRTLPSGAVIEAWTTRATVCALKVVGTETVEIPDPDFTPPMITVTRDVTEWDCSPLLGVAS